MDTFLDDVNYMVKKGDLVFDNGRLFDKRNCTYVVLELI